MDDVDWEAVDRDVMKICDVAEQHCRRVELLRPNLSQVKSSQAKPLMLLVAVAKHSAN